jgi:hypothetical protein
VTCAACGTGEYQPQTGQTACVACAAGKYRDTTVAASSAETTACKDCGAGEIWHYAWNFPAGSNFDPEVISYGAGSNARGWDEMTGPTAKKWGATLSLTF